MKPARWRGSGATILGCWSGTAHFRASLPRTAPARYSPHCQRERNGSRCRCRQIPRRLRGWSSKPGRTLSISARRSSCSRSATRRRSRRHSRMCGSCGRSRSSTRRASNAPMTIGGSPTFCCSTATSRATDRSAGLAACTTGASAGALSTKWVCRSSLPATSTPTTSPRLLPQCVRRASIRKPRRTEPTAIARISTRCAASSLPRNSPCQGGSPQLDGPIVLYHTQQLPAALRPGRAAETPVIIRLGRECRIENDRLAAVCRMRQWRPQLLCQCGQCGKHRHESSQGAVLHGASERVQHDLGTRNVEYTRLLDVQCLDDAVVDQHRIALRAHPHAFLPAVELEAYAARKLAAAVPQHDDVVCAIVLPAPGAHDKRVIDRNAGDRVDAFGLELGGFRDVAGQMALRAGPRIGARDREQSDFLTGKEFV